jgi:hypothetical protein
MLPQDSRSQAQVKEEVVIGLASRRKKSIHSYGDETQIFLLGRNPLSDAPYRNPSVVSNWQGMAVTL